MRQSQARQLATHIRNVVVCRDARMLASLDGVLFSGKTECVESHRVQHVKAAHALETCDRVSGDIAQWVSNVQAFA